MGMFGGGGGGGLSVDMIVNAIAQGFEKVMSQVDGLGKSVDNANKLIIDSSGRVAAVSDNTQKAITDAAAKTKAAKEAEAQAFEQMQKRMETASELAKQKAAEEAKSYQDLASSMQVTGAAFMAAAAAGGALLYSSVQVAAKAEMLAVVTKTLGQNVGWTEVEIRSLENTIAKMGLTLVTARSSIAKMIQGNIDLKYATELATVAQNAAVIANMTGSEAMDQLIQGIATAQVRVLRTMGIMTNFEDGYKRYAATLGKTTENLTEYEKAESRVQSVLAAGKNIQGAYAAAMETAGKQVLSLQRHIEESKRMLGEMWLPLYAQVVATITESLKVWEGLSKEQQNGISAAMGYGVAISAMEGAVFLSIGTIMKLTEKLKALQAAMAAGTSTAGINIGIAAIVAVVGAMVIAFYESQKAINAATEAFREQEKQIKETAGSYEEYIAKAREAAFAEMGKVGPVTNAPKPGTGGNVQVTVTGRMGPVVIAQAQMMTKAEYEHARSVEEEIRVEEIRAQRMAGWVAQEVKQIDGVLENTEAIKEQAKAFGVNAQAIKSSMDIMAKAVDAAITGTLKKNYEDLDRTLGDLKKTHGELSLELQKANKVAYGPNKEQIKEIGKEIKSLNIEIKDATEKYGKNSDEVKNLTKQHGNLMAELEKAKKGGFGVNAEKVKELTDKLKENEEAQRAAAAAAEEATKQFTYQQIAAGLDAGAQLELARSLGILDENTYEYEKALLNVRKAYQEGAYGATGTAEAQKKLGEETELTMKAYQRLIELNIPVNAGSIALMMKQLADEEKATADNAGQIPDAMGTAMDEAAAAADTKSGEISNSLGEVETAALNAMNKVDELGGSIDRLHDRTITITTQYKTTGTIAAPGGGGGQGSCFVAGTPVNVPGGTRPIDDLRVGSKVLAYDEIEGKNVIASIVARTIRDGQKVYEVESDHGKFKCTPKHRWMTRQGWKETRALSGQDEIMLVDGSYSRLRLAPKRIEGEHAVYNLTVENVHTYYVGGHLVHNWKGQFGLNQVVPPGFPNDNFPVYASSGERVVIIPKRTVSGFTPKELMSAPTGVSGGMFPGYSSSGDGEDMLTSTIMDNSTTINQFNNYSKAAAAISTAMVMNSRLRRLSDRMG